MNGTKCNLVGKSFGPRAAQVLLNNLKSGTMLTLVRELDHLFDKNALRVFISGPQSHGDLIGYIDRHNASVIAASMDDWNITTVDAVLTSSGSWNTPTLELVI